MLVNERNWANKRRVKMKKTMKFGHINLRMRGDLYDGLVRIKEITGASQTAVLNAVFEAFWVYLCRQGVAFEDMNPFGMINKMLADACGGNSNVQVEEDPENVDLGELEIE
jgi:hypothetical protein